jgi:hypothetical protein
MNGLENAQFDLGDARCSLETAIELLDSIGHDGQYDGRELDALIAQLRGIKGELEQSYIKLEHLQQHIET